MGKWLTLGEGQSSWAVGVLGRGRAGGWGALEERKVEENAGRQAGRSAESQQWPLTLVTGSSL